MQRYRRRSLWSHVDFVNCAGFVFDPLLIKLFENLEFKLNKNGRRCCKVCKWEIYIN